LHRDIDSYYRISYGNAMNTINAGDKIPDNWYEEPYGTKTQIRRINFSKISKSTHENWVGRPAVTFIKEDVYEKTD